MAKAVCDTCDEHKKGVRERQGVKLCRKCLAEAWEKGTLPAGANGHNGHGDLVSINEQQVLEAVKPHAADAARDVARDAVKDAVKTVRVKLPDGGSVDLDATHKRFKTLLDRVQALHPTPMFLVGPSGSGKTYAAEQLQDALNLPRCESISLSSDTTKAEIFGHTTADGGIVRTPFRQVFEHGGVFVFDELDRGNAKVLTAINKAVGNGAYSFPDGKVQRHDKAVFIATGNTYGHGADREYVGANQLDAATLRRFHTLDWGYDRDLERMLGEREAWTAWVHAVRDAVQELGLRHIVDTRMVIRGGKLLEAGVPWGQVEYEVLRDSGGMDRDTWDRVVETADTVDRDARATHPEK